MDLHPLFVHFPVALLSLYAILEIFPLEKKLGKGYFYVKFALLVVGTIMTAPAYWTGGIAGEGAEHGALGRVVAYHAFFAGGAVVAGIVLGILYILRFRDEAAHTEFGAFLARIIPEKVVSPFRSLMSRGFLVFGAIVLFLFVSFAGALGGSMVYGSSVDPLARFLYSVFGL